MIIKTSIPSYRRIQDTVFLRTDGIITTGKVHNTLRYYDITHYEFGVIVKHIKR